MFLHFVCVTLFHCTRATFNRTPCRLTRTLRIVYNCPKNDWLVSTLNLIDAVLIDLEMTRPLHKSADIFWTSFYKLDKSYITDRDLLVDSSNITYVHKIRAQRRRQGGRSDKSLTWDNSLILLPPNLKKLRLIISTCSLEPPEKTNYLFYKAPSKFCYNETQSQLRSL